MARSITDARQVTLRSFLTQIANATTYAGTADAKPANQSELDNLLSAINDELTPLLRLSANTPNSLIVNVGAATLTNSESGYQRSIPHIGALLPNTFSSGTVTFPAASGGNITTSTGGSTLLTVASGNYIKVLIYMDPTGALSTLPGVEAASIAAATVIAAPTKTLPIGYVVLQNVGGTIQNIAQSAIYQFGTGSGGSGSGTGSGIGDDLGSLQYKASFTDDFSDIPTGTSSPVDTTAGKTDSTLYSAANTYFRLSYDATKTVTGTGTAMTMSGAPTFTVKIGDILRVDTEARRITAVGSQTSYTIESAFTTNPSAAAATVSQAVYSKDLNNFSGDGLPISTAFSTSINQILVNYEDTTTLGDVIFDANTTPVIAYSASSDGTSYSAVSVRPTNLTDQVQSLNLPSSGTNLYLRFFANATSGSGSVNILGYKAFLHKDAVFQDGSLQAQSSAYTNGAGSAVNVSSVGVVSGKTRIKKTWSYPMGVNPGTNNGALMVYMNGQKVPRFISATATPDAYYKEIDQTTIELDSDYSGLPIFVEILQTVAVVDASDTNTTNITQSQESITEGFQPFVKTSQLINAVTAAGAPAAGTFHSTVVNRSSMPDLTQDLRARFGQNRVQTQVIYQLQNEFGPNGEPVFALVNDTYNQFRAVGVWASGTSNNGTFFSTVTVNDYVEITFYGTGLNIMANYGFAYDVRASVDGGSEGSNIFIATGSNILITRGYVANQIIPVVSGLALGVHTVKLRNNNANGINFFGYEIVNDTSTIRVNPGTAYVGSKKIVSSVQNALSYNSTFESGTLAARGGRVLVYQKADGSVVKAVTPADSQLNLTSTNHQNEEVARIFSPREFGANRADDFSTLTTTNSTRAFTLDDGVTTLAGSGVLISTGDNISLFDNTSYMILTFVGTGLDIVSTAGGGVTLGAASVDGVSIGNYARPTVANGIIKIVSGLPYGTHVVRLTMTAGGGSVCNKFIVYQPKKPSLPAGAVEIADYNAVATYSASGTVGVDATSTGVVRKSAAREVAYIGTWGYSLSIGEPNAVQVNTTTNGDYFEYTFFGTGIEILGRSGSGTNTMQVRIDGALYTGAATAIGAGGTWTPGTSTYLVSATTGAKLQISGLTLGQHTIRLTKSNAGDGFNLSGLDVIAPIHSQRSMVPYDIQNTLSVGNNSICDNRTFSPVKDVNAGTKNIAQAFSIASASTTSAVAVPVPDMSVVHTNKTGKIKITYNISHSTNSTGSGVSTRAYVNGIGVGVDRALSSPASGFGVIQYDSIVVNVPPGTHKIDLMWYSTNTSFTTTSGTRLLIVEEI